MNHLSTFTFAATPHIHFGVGQRQCVADLLASYGDSVLLVTGGRSFDDSPLCQALWHDLQQRFTVHHLRVTSEPSPSLVDEAVACYHAVAPACVLAMGGGSAVDAAKAIAGLLPSGDSVMAYLEGVGEGRSYCGPGTPFIAMPTTAGTGGETSKNAVLSHIGTNGYKKSFRDVALVPRHIVLDPELTVSCSPSVTAACGMDAFTQLLESYVSIRATPMTDALALSGLTQAAQALPLAVADGANIAARSSMLYASSLSGLTLANAGLGSVHGLASPIGAFFPMPHGAVCGSLLADACRINITAMKQRAPSAEGLLKYAHVGRIIADDTTLDDEAARQALLHTLSQWQTQFDIPRLSDYGVQMADIPRIIADISQGSIATNPIVLTQDELHELLAARI
jgi:alcohol dehydrogenase